LDSERAYDERVTTSTKTSEIRLRQESIRYWNRFLEEAEASAFGKVVGPTCHQIIDILSEDFRVDGKDSGEHQKQLEEQGIGKEGEIECQGMSDSMRNDENKCGQNDDGKTAKSDGDADWEYCQQLFGLPSASVKTSTSLLSTLREAEKAESSLGSLTESTPTPLKMNPLRACYPPEVLPIFVITSPLISNCLQDRSKVCHSMWRQLNGLENTIDAQSSSSFSTDCRGDCDKPKVTNSSQGVDTSICLYLPRLLSSWTETLHIIWDGLLSHYENTNDAPSMDSDDPRYYLNPNELASKRHSYHVSKRRHYEALLDRKVTTESQKSKIGTKRQQSLQDFILEFLEFIYEEPEEFVNQEHRERERGDSASLQTDGQSKRAFPRRGNLILLLEDPRILHPKAATGQGAASSSSGASSKPNNSNLVQSQLLETLAAWRGMHGIPVSLVVFNSVGSKHEIHQNNVLLNPSFESSASGGRFGIRTVRCSIPSSSLIAPHIPPSMAFGMWSHYFLQTTRNIPMPLLAPQKCHDQYSIDSTATESVLRMCRDALQNESSCSMWVSSIRARLASNFYTRKGSFVWDALNPNATAMMRAPAMLSEISVVNGGNIATDGTNINDGGHGKDQQHFSIGNDDVQIFQPEFVAWFCSYHKACTLLSSLTGDHKADMTPSNKCEALLKCYRLLWGSTEAEESKKHQEKPPKRRKLPMGDGHASDSRSGGNLQFWWSISCSLLPLHFLSLTVANEGVILSSNVASPSRSSANGNRKRQNEQSLGGQSRWVLERLADIYKQLLTKLEERDRGDMNSTLDYTTGIMIAGEGDRTKIKSIESETSADVGGCTKDLFSRKQKTKFVEATLRRYLQRGIEGDVEGNRNSFAATCETTATEECHQRSIQQLTTMVREFIVLVDALTTGQEKASSTERNDADGLAGDSKIRMGMTGSILEMNILALAQVEAWTQQWVETNPLMTASEEERAILELCLENRIDDPSHFGFYEKTEGRPLNFRRHVLDCLPVGSRLLYKALDGRLSVDRDEWFNSFGGTIEDFAIGVWTLRKCGLIRPKKTKAIATTATHRHEQRKTRKQQEVVSYEKVAVVWC
jgi:hypothetical protein